MDAKPQTTSPLVQVSTTVVLVDSETLRMHKRCACMAVPVRCLFALRRLRAVCRSCLNCNNNYLCPLRFRCKHQPPEGECQSFFMPLWRAMALGKDTNLLFSLSPLPPFLSLSLSLSFPSPSVSLPLSQLHILLWHSYCSG